MTLEDHLTAFDACREARKWARDYPTLRARVAKLEAALREIIHESEHTPHSWKERADRNAETARAALGAGKETP